MSQTSRKTKLVATSILATCMGALLAATCTSYRANADTQLPSARDRMILQPLASSPGPNVDAALNKLGMPTRQAVKMASSLHTEPEQAVVPDRWVELEYPKLRLGYYRSGHSGQEALAYVRVSSSAYPLQEGLQIGDSLDRFARVLGPLQQTAAERYTACDSWGHGDCLELRVANGRVMEVEQRFALD
ncbi:MAG: hypothetical protein ACO1RX_07100 [Candidatus Sericytochromatia bacterium]